MEVVKTNKSNMVENNDKIVALVGTIIEKAFKTPGTKRVLNHWKKNLKDTNDLKIKISLAKHHDIKTSIEALKDLMKANLMKAKKK